jgi:hypothetical protein
MAYIDYKVTSWVRMEINEEQIEEAQRLIRAGDRPNDLICYLDPTAIENLIEVEEYMPIEENGGKSTIELYSERCELLYSNEENGKDRNVKNPNL